MNDEKLTSLRIPPMRSDGSSSPGQYSDEAILEAEEKTVPFEQRKFFRCTNCGKIGTLSTLCVSSFWKVRCWNNCLPLIRVPSGYGIWMDIELEME